MERPPLAELKFGIIIISCNTEIIQNYQTLHKKDIKLTELDKDRY